MNFEIKKASIVTYSTFILILFLDQLTKQLVISSMPIEVNLEKKFATAYHAYEFLPFLYFNHVVNFGGTWSIFSNNMSFILIYNLVIYLSIIYYEFISKLKRSLILSFSLGFILAGSGNFIDRLRNGYVTDFIDVRNLFAQTIWPIFNIADISLNIGIALLILSYIITSFKSVKSDEKEKSL